jgi:DNA-binding response OmpR family regulator
MKVLLIEDERRMAEALAELLQREHYDVTVCLEGISGYQCICKNDYDIVVLDVMMPGMSGYEIAKGARAIGKETPILMLTAKSDVDDKVFGFDCGADDYLTKPFEAKELLARLRAMTRRMAGQSTDFLSTGDLTLSLKSFELVCSTSGQSIRLSKKEYRIIELFLRNQGRVLTREQLVLNIWGYESEAEYNNVEVYISFVRKKIAFIGSQQEIKSLRGLGYEMRDASVS